MHRDAKRHYSRIRFILLFTLILNWGVAAAKIIMGFLTNCNSMLADGFHSLSDGASNIIGLIGVTLSARPVDQDHPYGHSKYETLFSLGIAALLFLLAFNLARGGIARIFTPVIPRVEIMSFTVMLVTVAINIWVMSYEYRKGKALKSDMLIADSMHTKADIFTSVSVIVTLIAIKLGYSILDPVVTVLIACFIAYAGVEIVKDASKVLCDTIVMDVKNVSDIVLNVKGVKTCHKIRTRGRPDDICIDLHVQVDSSMHIDEAHKICYAIEEALKKNIPEVSDVLVHVEPKGAKKKR